MNRIPAFIRPIIVRLDNVAETTRDFISDGKLLARTRDYFSGLADMVEMMANDLQSDVLSIEDILSDESIEVEDNFDITNFNTSLESHVDSLLNIANYLNDINTHINEYVRDNIPTREIEPLRERILSLIDTVTTIAEDIRTIIGQLGGRRRRISKRKSHKRRKNKY